MKARLGSLAILLAALGGCGDGGGTGPGPGGEPDVGLPLDGGGSGEGGGAGGDAAPPNVVTLTSYGDWVAAQVNDEPWTRLAPTSGGQTYTIPITPGAPYRLAERGVNSMGYSYLSVTCATVDEASIWLGLHALTTHTVSGTVSGLQADEDVDVAMMGAFQVGVMPTSPEFYLHTVVDGTRDLIAIVHAPSVEPVRMTIARDLEVQGDRAGESVDVSPGSGLAFAAHGFTVTAGTGWARFFTANGSGAAGLGDTSLRPKWYAAQGTLRDGDLYSFFVLDETAKRRTMLNVPASEAPGDLRVDLLAVTPLAGIEMVSPAPGRLTGLAYVPGANSPPVGAYLIQVVQHSQNVQWDLLVTAGCLAGQTELTLPRLADVEGWDVTWGLRGGANTEWQATVLMADQPLSAWGTGAEVTSLPRLRLDSAELSGALFLY
jgi:hypothetical protein